MNKKYTKIISISIPVQWNNFQHIKTKNTITLLLNINSFTEQLFSCLNVIILSYWFKLPVAVDCVV